LCCPRPANVRTTRTICVSRFCRYSRHQAPRRCRFFRQRHCLHPRQHCRLSYPIPQRFLRGRQSRRCCLRVRAGRARVHALPFEVGAVPESVRVLPPSWPDAGAQDRRCAQRASSTCPDRSDRGHAGGPDPGLAANPCLSVGPCHAIGPDQGFDLCPWCASDLAFEVDRRLRPNQHLPQPKRRGAGESKSVFS
jgi:hypothetical protein